MTNRWLYIDFNSFFASVEQQLNPSLRKKPIAVIPVETDTTCAIAASYEAKAFGIHTGTPIFEAKKMCPQLICVLAHHEAYVEFHNKILEEIDKHIPISAVCSIDEMACRLMQNENPEQLAKNIKQALSKNIGECITCSMGVAANRYLAKIATDMQKPNGLVFLEHIEQLYPLSLKDLPGIGPNMEKRLLRHGIADIQKLLSLDAKALRRAWGSVIGERMWHLLRGADLPDPQTQSATISQSRVLPPPLRTPEKARLCARQLTLKASARLRRSLSTAARFTLSILLTDGSHQKKSLSCPAASDSFIFLDLLHKIWNEFTFPFPVKKVSISLHRLEPPSPLLFSSRIKEEKLSHTLDAIHQKFGKKSISLGPFMPHDTCVAFTHIPEKEEFDE